MILWLYDTSRSELVYADPEVGPVRFPLAVVQKWASEAPVKNSVDLYWEVVDDDHNIIIADNGTIGTILFNENALRKALPRADKSRLVMPGVRFQ